MIYVYTNKNKLPNIKLAICSIIEGNIKALMMKAIPLNERRIFKRDDHLFIVG